MAELEGVIKMAFRRFIEFTYAAKLMILGEETNVGKQQSLYKSWKLSKPLKSDTGE